MASETSAVGTIVIICHLVTEELFIINIELDLSMSAQGG